MSYAKRYTQSQVETATPERLLVLLFEAALKNVRAGAAALEQGRGPDASACLARAGDIVVELHATLARDRAPRLVDDLAEVYRFVCRRLLDASLQRDARAAREAERALAPLCEAFAGAVQQISSQP